MDAEETVFFFSSVELLVFDFTDFSFSFLLIFLFEVIPVVGVTAACCFNLAGFFALPPSDPAKFRFADLHIICCFPVGLNFLPAGFWLFFAAYALGEGFGAVLCAVFGFLEPAVSTGFLLVRSSFCDCVPWGTAFRCFVRIFTIDKLPPKTFSTNQGHVRNFCEQ